MLVDNILRIYHTSRAELMNFVCLTLAGPGSSTYDDISVRANLHESCEIPHLYNKGAYKCHAVFNCFTMLTVGMHAGHLIFIQFTQDFLKIFSDL